MKRLLQLVVLILAVGAVSFGVTRWLAREEPPADSLEWMTREFSLTAEQRSAIAGLQARYAVVCEAHCAAIMAARETGDPAELRRLEAVCTTATREHLHAVAACMDPEAARRFIALVEPKLAGHRHEAPLGLP